jgi:hypothetical protein
MLAVPGPWFLSPNKEDVVIGILPPGGMPRHPSQHPLSSMRGYTVGKFSSPVMAYQVAIFPMLVKLNDLILDYHQQREIVDDNAHETDHQTLSQQMHNLVLAANALRLYLGSTAEWPMDVKVLPNRWEKSVSPFSAEHLAKLTEAGFSDQVEMYRAWERKQPFREIIGVTW